MYEDKVGHGKSVHTIGGPIDSSSGELAIQLERLTCAMNSLNIEINDLRDKITPVLTPDNNEVAQPSAEQPREMYTPIGQLVFELNGKLDLCNEKLNNIRQRVSI